jgi:hypothetical protein
MPSASAPPPIMNPPPAMPSPVPQPGGNYPVWGVGPQMPPRPMQDPFSPPSYPQRPSVPSVAGFHRARKSVLKPWMLVVGALVMAGLAFAITRLLLS